LTSERLRHSPTLRLTPSLQLTNTMPEEKEKKEKKKKEKKEKTEEKLEEAAKEAVSEDTPAPVLAPVAPEPAAEEDSAPSESVFKEGPRKKIGNVFALFNKTQIDEFKEAFTMIDSDRDGIIGEDDLVGIFNSTGREPDRKVIKEMLKECPEKINFTQFLTLFGEKLHGTDSEQALKDAFTMFDEEKRGKLHEEYIKDLLLNVGDQYSKEEIKQVWKEAPIEGGMLDYMKFVRIIKRGAEDE